MQLSQVGELASSKSAMNTFAPELSALMTILRSTGPVISTRRSAIAGGYGATFQSASRIDAVSGRKSGSSPVRRPACRSPRRASSSLAPAAELALELGQERDDLGGEDVGGPVRSCAARVRRAPGCGGKGAADGHERPDVNRAGTWIRTMGPVR